MTQKLIFEYDLVAEMKTQAGEKPEAVYWKDLQVRCPPDLGPYNAIATSQMKAAIASTGPGWGTRDPDSQPTLRVYECWECEGACGSFTGSCPVVEKTGYSSVDHYLRSIWNACTQCQGSGIQITTRQRNGYRTSP